MLDLLILGCKDLRSMSREKIDCKSLVFLDVPTRWNFTYLMLETSLKFKKTFERLEEDDV